MAEKGFSSEVSSLRRIDVEVQGFNNDEIIKTHGHGSYEDFQHHAFHFLGQETRELVEKKVKQFKEDPDYEEKIKKASYSFNDLENLSREFASVFTTHDGVNHLERYLNALRFFSMGSSARLDEVAYLQMKDQTGCQTLLVQNKYTQEVVGLHMEEDAEDYGEGKDPFWGKRWVEMAVGEKKIQFCSYGGVLSFGATSGIVESKNGVFFQAADYISPKGEGKLWANALAFMTMDCANFDDIKELVENINRKKDLLKPLFSGGYVLHMVEARRGKKPEILSLEFGGDILKLVKPQETKERIISLGVNLPSDKELQEIDLVNLPQQEGESVEDYKDREIERKLTEKRYRRLSLMGKLVGKNFRNDEKGWGEEDSLKVAQDVLANKHGEWLDKWFTGFSNYIVAQHNFFYLSPEGKMKFIVRKGSPDKYKS
jgi:hypothetical protein